MFNVIPKILFLVLFLILISGCKDKNSGTSKDVDQSQVKKEWKEAGEVTKEYFEKNKENIMNELGVIKILYKYKIKILAVVLGVGIIVGGISLLSSNKYSSTSAISVQAPEVPLTGEIPPLTVETLRSLVESTGVKWELFQELRKDGIIEDDVDFLNLLSLIIARKNKIRAIPFST